MRRYLAVLLVAAACSRATRQQQDPPAETRSDKLIRARSAISGQYVVVLDGSVAAADLAAKAGELAGRHGGSVLHVYGAALNGFAVAMSARDALALAAEPDVRFVEEDGRVRVAATADGGAVGTAVSPPPAGTGVNLYVLDTGVRLDHLELAGRASAVYPEASVGPEAADCNGHGTWVAALAAGATYGVAPGALVRSVKVLGCDGSGGISSVLAGIEWVTRNRIAPAVALLAASGGPSLALDEAVANSIAAGTPYVVAAGNSGADACDASPGRAAAAITVGAVAPAPAGSVPPYTALAFSNGGRCVDVLAPGDSVVSAWNTNAGATQTMSGTSASAAQAAGEAVAFLALNPGASPDNVAGAIAGTSLVGAVAGLAPGTPNRVVRPDAVRGGHDTTAPAVAISVPAAGATLGGTVTITATASDDAGVTQVAFYVDGAYVAADATAPYAADWDTTGSGNGAHTLTARAYDAAGNVGESAAVEVTVSNPGFAVFDATTGAPRCGVPGPVCDSGPVLEGRGSVGPERNAPNTIGLPCADGGAGFFHIDESVDAIRIATLDGSPLAVGKGLEIRVKVWAYVDYSADALDLYIARGASAPQWEYVTTLHPTEVGQQILSFRHTLGEGSLQAIRAAFRFGGSAATCTDGIYDDRDDIVFAVAAGTPDTTNPAVSVAAPLSGAVHGGATTLKAIATDDRGVVNRVEFLVDGKVVATSWAAEEGTDRFEAPWNAATVPDGTHQIAARAVDGVGNVQTSAAVTFQVADIVAPTVAIVSPEADESAGGVVTIAADAWDDRAVQRVSFLVNGGLVGQANAAPWAVGWDTAGVSSIVTLTARAYDAAGHETASTPVTVFVDHVAPTVQITSPLDGDVISSTVTLAATIGDNRGIANVSKVEFLANGKVIATDDRIYPTAPCSLPWRTGSYPNGSYQVVAKAYDAAGNVGTSDSIQVEVKDDTPPTLAIVTPADGSSIRLVAELTAVATDDGLLDRVEMVLAAKKLLVPATPPYTTLVDTVGEGLMDGEYTVTATAFDAAGNSTTAAAKVWVDNTPPLIQLTAPASAANVSGTYTLKATATDNQKVDHVDFYVGSAVLATDATEPFEVDWATTAFDNGTYEIAAIGYDGAGNATTSAIVPLMVWNASTTDYDAARRVPACATVAPFCFSGTLLESRSALLQPLAEAHAPNTLDGCADGAFGDYHVDESIDGITVRTLDGTSLAPGKAVAVDVRFFAVSPDFDRVDLFYAADANAPAWAWFATAVPTASGFQTLSATYVLPSGPLQAVRAASRYAENGPAACAPGSFDDRDDVVFAVVTPGTDRAPPTVAITNPADGGTVHGMVLVKATAADDQGVARVEFEVDGVLVATDALAPYELEWDSSSVADGSRNITATAYDTSGNATTSNPVFVTVATAANAQYDAARLAPACATRSSFCDTGILVEGRDLLGPEAHAPNTLQASCPDGDQGMYLREESIERIVLRTGDGLGLAPGKEARVEVTVFASSAYDADALELYHATSADSPAWRHVATLLPARAGLQVLSTTYRLPPGALQAVRARFRYGGIAAPCGTVIANGNVVSGIYDDHDDVAFSVPFAANASRDPALKVPRCTDGTFYCDSGALLDGRAGLGPEPHAPNTLRSSCADGPAGAYHVDPSIDALRVYSADATPLAAGQTVVAEVQVFASDTFADEAVDLYVTDDAMAVSPAWTFVATLSPERPGMQTLAAELPLGTGAVQAIRASHRDAAALPDPCTTGAMDDHDDLAFDVAP
jgi:subtilisin family serine protease